MPKKNGRPTPRATPASKPKNGSQTPRDRSQPSLMQCYNSLPQLPTPPAVSCEVSVIRHDSESQSTTGTLRQATLLSHPARTTSTRSERVIQQASPLSQTRTDTTWDQIDPLCITETAVTMSPVYSNTTDSSRQYKQITLQHDHTTSPDCLSTERSPHVSGPRDAPHYQREPTAATPRATPRRQAKLFQPSKPRPPEEGIPQAARCSQPPGDSTPAPKTKIGSHTPRDRSQPSIPQCYRNTPQLPTHPTVRYEVSVLNDDSKSQSAAGTFRRANLLSHPAIMTPST